MIKMIRTDSTNQDFITLVRYLDADLAKRDGAEHGFYAQFNTIDKLKYVVVVYEGNDAVGCGAIKKYSPNTMEIKRMYTLLFPTMASILKLKTASALKNIFNNGRDSSMVCGMA